jgi:hypothetical protein
MQFLHRLKLSDDAFLIPDKIYIRDCMRTVFGLFDQDVEQTPRRPPDQRRSVALVGSPGVGKSILFFLAALHQAQKSPTVYYRRTGSEDVSVFVMTPQAGGVGIWFSRDVKKDLLGGEGLSAINRDLLSYGIIPRAVFYTFVDGPKYHETHKADIMWDRYDYFCTSGGMRPYSNGDELKRLWILDGWSEQEAIDWLSYFMVERNCADKHRAMAPDSFRRKEERTEAYQAAAKKAYWLCGGNIRSMRKAIVSNDLWTNEKKDLDFRMNVLNYEMMEMAIASSDRGPESSDRLRTMFWRLADAENGAFRMSAIQVVDSAYVLAAFQQNVSQGKFFATYKVVATSTNRTLEGSFFELVIHKMIQSNSQLPAGNALKFPNVDKSCRSVGASWKEDLAALDEPNMYWIPNTSNFRNIDSAIVHNDILYAFQMTIKESHKFNCSTFMVDVKTLRKSAAFRALSRAVVVFFVVPLGVDFTPPRDEGSIEFRTHHVDMKSLDTLTESLHALFAFEA